MTDKKQLEDIRDSIWSMMNSFLDRKEMTAIQFLTIVQSTILEIGIITNLKPQYLMVAQLLTLGMTKDEVVELVEDVYRTNQQLISNMN